ncbi:MAG: YybH family protein [Myxococcaceae bacterium]
MKAFKWVACAAVLAAVPGMAKGTMDKSADSKSTSMKSESNDQMAQGQMAQGQMAQGGSGQMSFKDKGSTKSRDAIEKRTKEYEHAMNAHDVDKMASMYTADATVMGPDGKTATGKEEIRSMLQQDAQGPMKDAKSQFTISSVRELSPTLAIVDMDQHLDGAPQGMPQDMHSTVIVKKQGGTWMAQAVRSAAPMQMNQGVGGSGDIQETQPVIEENTGGSGTATQPSDSNMQKTSPDDITQPRHSQDQMTPGGAQDEKHQQ